MDLKWLTGEGEGEDTDGDDPRHSAVALPEICHQILEEHAQALEGPVGADLHHEEGQGHGPAPATLRHLRVHIRTQATLEFGHPHG